MDDRPLIYEVDDDGVATITFNRPDQLNAMSAEMGAQFVTVLNEADRDDAVKAIVITGAGRAFCAGADLSSGPSAFTGSSTSTAVRDAFADRDWGGVLNLRLFEMNKPLIAAVNGASVGVGATLTLPCDIRVASTTARFGFVFARRGIVTDGCASWFLPRVVGVSTALRWCMTGTVFAAEEALREGLVSALYEPDELLDAARGLAREIATASSPAAVAITRRLLWHGLVADHPMEQHRYETTAIRSMIATGDATEGVASFLEKRPANFHTTVPASLADPWPLWDEPAW